MKTPHLIAWCLAILLPACTQEPAVTTSSPEALKAYDEGIRQFDNFYYVEAKKSFERAQQLDSNFAMAYARLAWLYARSDNETEAREEIAKATARAAHTTRREQLIIRLFDETIHFRNAAAAATTDTLIDLYPHEAEAYVWRGNFYEMNKKYDDALAMYEKAVQTDTSYAPAAMSLGYAYSARGDFDNAIAQMNRYIRLVPDAADPHASLADILYRVGRYQEALEQYQTSLKLKPDYWYAFIRIGDIDATLGRLREADTQYDLGMAKSMITNQSRASHLAMEASLQYRRGKYEEVIRLCEQSLALDSTNGIAAYRRVMALIKLKRFDEAEASIAAIRQEIARRNLTESMAMLQFHLVRANFFEAKGLLDEAIAACDSAREYGSELTRSEVYHELAEIRLQQGDYDAALEALEEALRYNSNAPYALLTLAKVYKATGDAQMVREIGGRILELWKEADPDFQPLIELKRLMGNTRSVSLS